MNDANCAFSYQLDSGIKKTKKLAEASFLV
jgi:hypothetical protein